MQILTWVLAAVSTLGIGGSIVAAVFFPTVAMPILERIVGRVLDCKACLIALAFVVSVVASYWYGHHGEYARGYDAALEAIAAEDDAAIQRATEKRSIWKECRARNGEWDQSTGECK